MPLLSKLKNPAVLRAVGAASRRVKGNKTYRAVADAVDPQSPFTKKDRAKYLSRHFKDKVPGLKRSKTSMAIESVKKGLKANFGTAPIKSSIEGHRDLINKPKKTLKRGIDEVKKDKVLAALSVGFAASEAADIKRSFGPSKKDTEKIKKKLGPRNAEAYKYYKKRVSRENGGGPGERIGKFIGGNASFLAMMQRRRVPFMGHVLGGVAGYKAGGSIGKSFDKKFEKDPRDRMSTEQSARLVKAMERHSKRS